MLQWPNISELEIGRAFLAAINRGGLIKPSDICYITCLHTADLYEYIRDDSILMKELLSSRNPRALFFELFLGKLKSFEKSKSILLSECTNSKHKFESNVRKLATVTFNMFAKNLAAEYNNTKHKGTKRGNEHNAIRKETLQI